jgi:hypothetical protein
MVDAIKREISAVFPSKDLGDLSFLLGVVMTGSVDKKTLTLSQKSYIERLAERFSIEPDELSETPLYDYPDLGDAAGDILTPDHKTRFQEIVGSLLYLARWTRPDISCSVGLLGRLAAQPREQHLKLARRLLGYVVKSKEQALMMECQSPTFELTGFSDADWGGDPETSKSTSGYLVRLAGCLVSWNSIRQNCTATSTRDSEIISSSELVKEMMAIENLLQDMKVPVTRRTIHCDNQAAIQTIRNGGYCRKSRHLSIRRMFVWDFVETADLRFVPSEENQADILTKPLKKVKLKRAMNLLHPQSRERGSVDFIPVPAIAE